MWGFTLWAILRCYSFSRGGNGAIVFGGFIECVVFVLLASGGVAPRLNASHERLFVRSYHPAKGEFGFGFMVHRESLVTLVPLAKALKSLNPDIEIVANTEHRGGKWPVIMMCFLSTDNR